MDKGYQPITIPRCQWKKDSLTAQSGTMTAQPLEPGFGFTLGNALRRVLLGGVEGSAVTSVIIKGVNNEFSALPDVVEDAMQLILNIKELVVKNTTGKPGTMRLQVKGPRVVTAGDIETDEHLSVVNKDLIIAHVSEGGTLEITFFVESGRGYQPARWPVDKGLQEDGRIYLDAMFSPVRRVTYDVEKTRVGDAIDFDKLTFTVTTDGSESPVEVVHYAVSVLRTQLEHMLTAPEIPFNEITAAAAIAAAATEEAANQVAPVEEQVAVEASADTSIIDLLSKPIDVLEFSMRAHNCLAAAGIKRVIDLVSLTEEEAEGIKNFGKKSLDEVKEALQGFGLSFGMHIKDSDLEKIIEKENKS